LQVLVNLIFVVYGSFMYGLQRLCFGPLRPNEIEQLYEKAWFAVTETCLAMTIFREELGAFFLVMFTALVTGKVWGWIGDGRVEVLEQQPPANPLLFHARLGLSLFVSVAYDIWLLTYAVNTVVEEARPNMMVMFLFEFAVLAVSSLHTVARYGISLAEQHVVKTQTRQRLEDRRRRVREERAEILRRRETEGAADDDQELPDENDVDEMDIEVPGWEAKGQWVLSMDLFAGESVEVLPESNTSADIVSRLYQVRHLHDLLLRPHELLRPPYPHYEGLVHDDEVVPQEAPCPHPLPPGPEAHGPVSGRYR
jgi:E3 ubiquitin-protein ligase synoviolin